MTDCEKNGPPKKAAAAVKKQDCTKLEGDKKTECEKANKLAEALAKCATKKDAEKKKCEEDAKAASGATALFATATAAVALAALV